MQYQPKASYELYSWYGERMPWLELPGVEDPDRPPVGVYGFKIKVESIFYPRQILFCCRVDAAVAL